MCLLCHSSCNRVTVHTTKYTNTLEAVQHHLACLVFNKYGSLKYGSLALVNFHILPVKKDIQSYVTREVVLLQAELFWENNYIDIAIS